MSSPDWAVYRAFHSVYAANAGVQAVTPGAKFTRSGEIVHISQPPRAECRVDIAAIDGAPVRYQASVTVLCFDNDAEGNGYGDTPQADSRVERYAESVRAAFDGATLTLSGWLFSSPQLVSGPQLVAAPAGHVGRGMVFGLIVAPSSSSIPLMGSSASLAGLSGFDVTGWQVSPYARATEVFQPRAGIRDLRTALDTAATFQIDGIATSTSLFPVVGATVSATFTATSGVNIVTNVKVLQYRWSAQPGAAVPQTISILGHIDDDDCQLLPQE